MHRPEQEFIFFSQTSGFGTGEQPVAEFGMYQIDRYRQRAGAGFVRRFCLNVMSRGRSYFIADTCLPKRDL